MAREKIKSEVKFEDCEIYLMNSELCYPMGDFKAKIIIMCPNEAVMNRIEEWLKFFSLFGRQCDLKQMKKQQDSNSITAGAILKSS